MVHKKEEGTYHRIEKLTKEMPGFLSPRRGLPLLLIQELIRNRGFLTDPKQHTGSLLLNASWQIPRWQTSGLPLELEPQLILIVTHQQAKWHTYMCQDNSKANQKVQEVGSGPIPGHLPQLAVILSPLISLWNYSLLWKLTGFPGGEVVKNLPANVGHTRDVGLIPEWGRSSGEGNGNPLQYSCLGNPMDREARQAAVHRFCKGLDMT